MIAQQQLSLTEFVTHVYGLERGICPDALEQLVVAARLFERWAGRRVPIAALDEATINRWLVSLEATEQAPRTIKNKRTALLAAWRYAATIGYHDREPNTRRVRRIRVARPVPRCWTIEQIRRLLAAAETRPGCYYRSGIRRSRWWSAFIRTAYDTGLRLGDLLRLTTEDVQADGTIVVAQHKTGHVHVTPPLWPATLEAIRATFPPHRELLFPWPYRREYIYDEIKIIRDAAGINTGTIKWLRRSSVSYYVRDNPGGGQAHLGHRSPGLAERAYIDPTISYGVRPQVPTL